MNAEQISHAELVSITAKLTRRILANPVATGKEKYALTKIMIQSTKLELPEVIEEIKLEKGNNGKRTNL